MTTNTFDTVYEFGRNIKIDANPIHTSGWALLAMLVCLVILVMLYIAYSPATSLFAIGIFIPVSVYAVTTLFGDLAHYNEHYNEQLRATVSDNQEAFDQSVDAWLSEHDLTRDMLCNNSTIYNPDSLKRIAKDDTLMCGTQVHSVQPGMFIINNNDKDADSDHTVTVFAGDYADRAVMMYRKEYSEEPSGETADLY